MILPIAYGVIAALGVSLALAVAGAGGAVERTGMSEVLQLVGWLLLASGITAVAQWVHSRGRATQSELELEKYDGVPDLLIHLHSPALPDRSSRWAFRGAFSWILVSLGLPVGPEGGASELVQSLAMRARSASTRWSDLIRRSDAAMAIAAGISASFGAPFAAVLIPSELAIGGRVLNSVLTSLSAFLTVQYLSKLFARFGIPVLGFRDRLGSLWGFRLLDWKEWALVGLVVVVVSVIAALSLIGLRQVRGALESLGRSKGMYMTLLSALIIVFAVLISPGMALPAPMVFEQIIRGELSVQVCMGLFAFLFLILLALGSGMGTMGIWWPTFLAGTALSYGLLLLLPVAWFSRGFLPNAALMGAVALCSVWLRAPISLAVLAFEITQNGTLLLPCLIAATLARWIDRKLGQTAWFDQVLQAKGFPIQDGRAVSVLKSLKVSDAMVRNFESVHERDSIRSCHDRIRGCHYPFLAVVDHQEKFKGLLTVDLIEQGLASQAQAPSSEESHAHEKLSGLLEAKDLLYRSGLSFRAVRPDVSLAELRGVFEGQSCIAVVEADGRTVGLLFAHDVRQCYDREVARLSFVIQAEQAR